MKKRFTKKQLDVMKVLWESATPMIASDIVRKDDALNINTVQACLRSLIANHSIKWQISSTAVRCLPEAMRQSFPVMSILAILVQIYSETGRNLR